MISLSDAKPLKVGFIGGSVNSAVGYAHFAATQMDGLFEIVAGCFSRDTATNTATALRYAIASDHVYANWQDMLGAEKQNLDAIVILTPTPDHDESIIAALEAGYNVICEKALTDSVAKAENIKRTLAATGGFLAVTYNYSGYPMIRELRRLIEDGALGHILQIQVEMPQEGFIRKNKNGAASQPQSWRLRDGDIATLHLDLGVHVHQLVQYTTGLQPLEVVAISERFGDFPGIVDDLNALARYEGGAVANFWYSKTALGQRNGLKVRIFGDMASAEWIQTNPEILSVSYADGRREILDRGALNLLTDMARYTRFKPGHPAGYIEAFANLYADIYQNLRAHQDGTLGEAVSREVFGVELAIDGLQFLEAMSQSVRNQCWTKIKPCVQRIGI